VGTSTSYSAPPAWSDLKADVTRAATSGALNASTAAELVRSFVRHAGGVEGFARGAGGGGGGGVASGRAARSAASRLAGFLSEVGRSGLDVALRDAGWGDLVGRPVSEVLAALLDRLGGDASTIDAVDARMALARLEEQYFGAAATPEELEALLLAQVANIETVLRDFFGLYLYEVFCRIFFERLVQRVGDTRAHALLDQIRDFIVATLANRTGTRDVSSVDWAGAEGAAMTADIMETTLSVFG